MKKQIIIAMGCLAMLPGCDDEPDFEQHYVSENLVIGDLNAPGLVYVDFSPDTAVDPQPGAEDDISLDVNGDGTLDLRIISIINDSRRLISNSSMLASGTTEFSYESTTGNYYNYTDTINDTVKVYYENSSASQPPNSSVHNTAAMLSPQAYDAGDTITDGVALWRTSADLARLNIGTDTIGNRYNVYDLRFGKWNGAGAKHAGFRFIKGREVYYGWIKLEVIDTKIVVYEYAYRRITEI